MPTVSQRSDTKFSAIIEGGPELAAKLAAMDKKLRNVVAKDAVSAMGRVIADQWANAVPIGKPPDDPHPGAYQRAMREPTAVTVRASTNGANGTVRPATLADLADDQQPRLYAARLEFGDADREAEPSARPAFEAAQQPALKTISDMLAKALQ